MPVPQHEYEQCHTDQKHNIMLQKMMMIQLQDLFFSIVGTVLSLIPLYSLSRFESYSEPLT